VQKEIGRGGMGTVYLAIRDDDQYRKRVAIKVVKRGMDSQDALRRFRHERQILANLDHPYIARLLDGGTLADGRPFFVMEYVEGQPIDSYCRQHRLDLRERCRLFQKVCEAVSYAHHSLVVHRDLKPGNIFVTPDGAPKLLDFGVAKLLTDDEFELSPSAAATQPLTPEYASPEQVKGLPVTAGTDVYSLGAVFYELLTGAKAQSVTSPSPAELERAICGAEVTPPSLAVKSKSNWPVSWHRQLSGDLDCIAMRAIRKHADRRYQSVAQFADDIQRYLDGRPVLARRSSIAYRAWKFLSRHRLAVACAAIVTASLISSVIVARAGQQRAEQRLSQMMELANRSLFDVHDSIERLPGAMDARRKIVGTTLQFLEQLSKDEQLSKEARISNQDGQDQRLRLALSAAYLRLGETQGYLQKPNLGDTAGALKSYREAARLIEPLRARGPEDPNLLSRWLEIQRRIGEALFDSGDMKAAAGTFQNAIPAAQLLARLDSSNPEAVRQEGFLYENLGDVFQFTNPELALEYAGKALAIASALDAVHAGNASILYQISDAHAEAGRILNRRGDLKGALEHFRQCASLRERVVQIQPNDVVFRRNLLIAYGHVGAILGLPTVDNLGDPRGALRYYRKAVAIAREIVATDPQGSTGQYDLASAMLRMASIEVPPGELPASLDALRQAAAILQRLSDADPSAIRYTHGLVLAHQYAGQRLLALGQREEAEVEYRRVVGIAETALTAHRDDTPSLGVLLSVRKALADMLVSAGDGTGAIKEVRQAISVADRVSARYSPEMRSTHLYRAYLNAASVYRTLGEWNQAGEAARNASANLRMLPSCGIRCAKDQELAETLIAQSDRRTGDLGAKWAKRNTLQFAHDQPRPDNPARSPGSR
jgi:serine/threonine protein kinase